MKTPLLLGLLAPIVLVGCGGIGTEQLKADLVSASGPDFEFNSPDDFTKLRVVGRNSYRDLEEYRVKAELNNHQGDRGLWYAEMLMTYQNGELMEVKVESLENPVLEAEAVMAAMATASERYRTDCGSYPISFEQLVGYGCTHENYLDDDFANNLETIETPTFLNYMGNSVTISIHGIGNYEGFSCSQEMGIRNNGMSCS